MFKIDKDNQFRQAEQPIEQMSVELIQPSLEIVEELSEDQKYIEEELEVTRGWNQR